MKTINLSGVVGWDITAKGLINKLPKNEEKAVIKVDSVGGSVFEGYRLFNAIIDNKDKIDHIELGVLAASAASFFPLAIGIKNIKVRENTTFMGHKAWGFTVGNSDEMKLDASILDGLDRIIARIYSKITKKTIDETLLDMKNEFWLIGGQSVVDAGFASEVIEDGEAEESEEIEPLTSIEVNAMIKEAKNKLMTSEIDEDLQKWAAQIKTELGTEDPNNQVPLNGNNSEPGEPEGKNNKKEEFLDMDLQEFLNKNPKAKTEFDNSVAEKAKDEIKNSVEEERTRVFDILNLSGVKLPQNIIDSAKNGETVSDFMRNELEARNKVTVTTSNTVEIGQVAAGGQLPGSVEGSQQNETKDVDSMFKNVKDGKNGTGNTK